MSGCARTAPCLLLLACLAASPPPASAQDAPSAEARARIAREMAAAATPGPAHERLSALAGEWDVEVRMWSGPGADPVVARGRAEATSILGGRFVDVRESLEGDLAFDVRTLLGHDNRWGEYTLIQMDTWGTYHVAARGPSTPGRDTLVMVGEDLDPLARHVQRYEMRVLLDGPDAWRLQIWMLDPVHTRGEGPFLIIQHAYARAGGTP